MPKKEKSDKSVKAAKGEKKPLFSDRQRKVLLIILVAMFILVPVVDNFRCKAACLKRVKTPYPEIACKYECPWLWDRK
jgi:bifunctional ADP-heptose synthase (sugar kinase/adenylyltransferase)